MVWGDDEISHYRVVGEFDAQGRRLPALDAAAIEDEAYGLWMRRAGEEGFVDGEGELVAAMLVEQSQQAVDGGGEVALAFCESDEQRLGGGHGAQQAVLAAMQTRLAFGLPEGVEVF